MSLQTAVYVVHVRICCDGDDCLNYQDLQRSFEHWPSEEDFQQTVDELSKQTPKGWVRFLTMGHERRDYCAACWK